MLSSLLMMSAMPGAQVYNDYEFNPQSMIWYKSLSIEQKIGLKELSASICGIQFEILTTLFGLKGAISLLHEKLVKENIIEA